MSGDTGPWFMGPATDASGFYKLGRPYEANHTGTNSNAASYAVIKAMFKLSPRIDFWVLAVAVRHHKHGTKVAKGPQAFVRYLIRNGHLVKC